MDQLKNWVFSLEQIVVFLLFSLLYLLAVISIRSLLWSRIKSLEIDDSKIASFKRTFFWIAVVVFLLCSIYMLGLDYSFSEFENVSLSISLFLKGLLIFQVARLVDWLLVNLYIKKYYSSRDNLQKGQVRFDTETSASQIIKYILYAIAGIFVIRTFGVDKEIYDVTLQSGETISFRLTNIIAAILVLLFARLIIWVLTQLILHGIYRRNSIDVGAQFAINQLLKYVIYIIAVFIALDKLGINMTLIWGGAAALLVGIGLGLQQTFNDFFSGIVLLFERSVAVGDTLDLNGEIGIVKKIGLRSSILETRGNMTMIVPNSELVNQKVLNWNHFNDRVRFVLSIGVAYGSDTEKVKELLIQIADENSNVLKYPSPIVRFEKFGDSSLDFKLYFYSKKLLEINDIKSDMRFALDKAFRDNNISIPFPQREIVVRQA